MTGTRWLLGALAAAALATVGCGEAKERLAQAKDRLGQVAQEVLSPAQVASLQCKPALKKLSEYEGRGSGSDEDLIDACVVWYASQANEADLLKLSCMAGADSESAWDECRQGGIAMAPASNPHAGEGPRAKREEGKVGKSDAKMDRGKGNKVQMAVRALDKQIAEDAGVLGALRDGSSLDGVFGASNLYSDIINGVGGLIGAKGTQLGSGGLGSRGSGFGGGRTAAGLSGLGTKGRGKGASGYGSGGGNFGAKGSGGTVRIGGVPIILGALDKSLIDAVIKRHMNQIRYCYQRQLTKNPALGGKIVVKFVIGKDGTVSSATTKSSTVKGYGLSRRGAIPAVESCINGRFMRFKFPEPKGGGIVIVSYPFIFAPK